jgi:hypothetical protein
MRRLTLLTLVVLAVSASASAAATTPTQYRARLNAICRSYTPKLKAQEAAEQKAEKAKNAAAAARALGAFLALGLKQDLALEAVPVPASLKPTMTPIMATFEKIDAHIKAAVVAGIKGNAKTFASHMTAIETLAKPLNAKLDAAGLKDCGSNQS